MRRSALGRWKRLQDRSNERFPPESLPFPTAAQVDLLKAALFPVDQAAPAWRRWKDRGLQLEIADGESIRLFPQLWANREAAGIEPEDATLLKGVYRRALAANAVELGAALTAVRILTDAGIPAILFKGAAIIALADTSLGLRQIGDVDILVPEADAAQAIRLLMHAGYTPAKPGGPQIGVVHAWAGYGPRGSSLDVHWWAFKTAGDDGSMFRSAQNATLLGREVLVPSVTECLITTVGNAFHDQGAPVRWVADSLLLLRMGDIDWAVVLDRAAQRFGLTLSLSAGLEFLADEFAAPVPEDVLDELLRRPVHWRERAAYWAMVNRPPAGTNTLGQLERHHARRRHYPTGVPRSFLAHLAAATGDRTGRRRDLFRGVPRKNIGAAVVLLLRYLRTGSGKELRRQWAAVGRAPGSGAARRRNNGA